MLPSYPSTGGAADRALCHAPSGTPNGSSNLLVVKNSPPRSVSEQKALVRAWFVARTQGEVQAAFCARQEPRISSRALRSYVHRHRPTGPIGDVALAIIDRAIVGLQDLRASLAEGYADRTTEKQLPAVPEPGIDALIAPIPPKVVTRSDEPRRPFNFDEDDEP
jgi:hypothetical protein